MAATTTLTERAVLTTANSAADERVRDSLLKLLTDFFISFVPGYTDTTTPTWATYVELHHHLAKLSGNNTYSDFIRNDKMSCVQVKYLDYMGFSAYLTPRFPWKVFLFKHPMTGRLIEHPLEDEVMARTVLSHGVMLPCHAHIKVVDIKTGERKVSGETTTSKGSDETFTSKDSAETTATKDSGEATAAKAFGETPVPKRSGETTTSSTATPISSPTHTATSSNASVRTTDEPGVTRVLYDAATCTTQDKSLGIHPVKLIDHNGLQRSHTILLTGPAPMNTVQNIRNIVTTNIKYDLIKITSHLHKDGELKTLGLEIAAARNQHEYMYDTIKTYVDKFGARLGFKVEMV